MRVKKKAKILWFLLLVTAFSANAQETAQGNGQGSNGPAAKFLPDISLNADFSGVYRSLGQSAFNTMRLPGFGESGSYTDTLNPSIGFNFNYAEMTFYSAVDPFFDFFAAFHLTAGTFEIEEAYAKTLGLPANFQVKLGKFLSSFGRLNDVHSHAWDFSDQPLVYHAFFGAENLNELGARLTWLVPVPFYWLIGAEALGGSNVYSFGSAGFTTGSYSVSDGHDPEVYTGYMKSSFDLDDLVILIGLSAAHGVKRYDNNIASGGYGIAGSCGLLGADVTLKWIIDSARFLALQTEYIYRNVDGSQYASGVKQSYLANQSGLYSKLVFQFYKGWKTGIRFDLLHKNQVLVNGKDQVYPQNLTRYSVMLEYAPSEFSRFRLQYNYDLSGYNGAVSEVNQQVSLDANFNIGTHGAHSF